MAAFNIKDVAAGALFAAIGVFFLIGALSLDIGTAFKMGPGYFPLVLSALLILFGIAVMATGIKSPAEVIGVIPWRGLAFILAAPVIFGATVRGLGLVAALAIGVFVAAFASRRTSFPLAIALAAGLTVFCVLVFSYGLGLPLRLKGPWLPF